jgi:hypothetical protein
VSVTASYTAHRARCSLTFPHAHAKLQLELVLVSFNGGGPCRVVAGGSLFRRVLLLGVLGPVDFMGRGCRSESRGPCS